MEQSEYDLSFVAPERRNDVLRRIAAVERYLADPGRAMAEQCAEQVGLAYSQFYRLVNAWKAGKRPHELPGSGFTRHYKSRFSDEQQQILADAQHELADQPLRSVIDRVRILARDKDVDIAESDTTLRNAILKLRHGRLSPKAWEQGADLMVSHCAVDRPLSLGKIGATMPLCTFVVDLRGQEPKLLGLSVSDWGVTAASTGEAIAEAIGRLTAGQADTEEATVIAFASYPGDDWADLRQSLTDAGLRLQTRESARIIPGRELTYLFGPRPFGILFKPRFVNAAPTKRTPTPRGDGHVMSLANIENFIRNRLSRLFARDADPVLIDKESRTALLQALAARSAGSQA